VRTGRRPGRAGRRARAARPGRASHSAPTYLGHPGSVWIRVLLDPDPLVRRLGVYALGEIGPGGPVAAAGALGRALGDAASYVRAWAAAALARVDPEDSRPVPALVAAMRDPAPFVRSLGAWHLGRIGVGRAGVETALPVLEALAADPDPSVRTEAGLALRILRRAAARTPER
jgi:HEAT repeat protein